MATYAERDEVLRELGYSSYAEYLKSREWLRIRTQVLRRYRYCCGVCTKRARDVHHISYGQEVLLGESLDQLVPLCGRCHVTVEFDEASEKRTLHQSQKAYSRLQRGRCLTCGRMTGRKTWKYCSLHYRRSR